MPRPFAPERREQVLDQAIAFLAENGLANLSSRRLAAAIGTSTNVIFYQFGSKEGLLQACLSRARNENLKMLDAFRADNPHGSAARGFEAIWDWWTEEPSRIAYSRLNMEAMMTSAIGTEAARAELLEFWVQYFVEWLEQDGHPSSEARALSSLLLAVLSGLTIDLLSTRDTARIEASVRSFAQMLAYQR